MKTPDWIQKARLQWEFTGQKRPDFAKEPDPGQESVWDYPRPPKVDPDSRKIVVKSEEILIADTTHAVRILETASPPTIYIPKEDINMDVLIKTDGHSLCEWKGNATYWSVVLPNKKITKCGWSYEKPFEEFESIAGYLSFYPASLECFINDEKVKPQPGGFYGGWMTSEIVGPVKGEPGING